MEKRPKTTMLFRRMISLVLAAVMFAGMLPAIPQAYAAETAEEAVTETETAVTETPEEDPEVTRAQWLQALVETFEMTVEGGSYPDNYFSDLSSDADYYYDMLLAVEFGVVNVEAGGALRPDEAATREFAAQTLNFCLGFQLDAGAEYTFSESSTVTYPNDIQIAIDRGWFALSGGAFLPEQAITADEMDGMIEDAAEVWASSQVSEDYDCVYSFTSEVIEIPQDVVAEYHETHVVIYDCPVTLASGNVFAVYFNGLPCLYLAGSVTVDGNATTVTVTELEEDGYYESIDAQGVVDAQFTQFEMLEGTEVIYIDEDTGTEYTDPQVAEYALRSRGTVNFNRTLNVKKSLSIQGISGYVNVKLKNPKIVYDLSSDKKVSVQLVSQVESTYGISCDTVELQGFEPIPIIKWVAPGVGGLTVSLVLEAKASVEGTTSGNLTAGIAYENGGFRLIKDFQKTAFAMVMKISGKVGVQATLGITDIPGDMIEGYIYGEIGGAAEVAHKTYTDNSTCTHAAIYMYAETGAKVSASILFVKKSYEATVEIWNDDNSPIRVVHHYENGVMVPGCTKDEPFGNDHGYYTPTDSPYWGSNWSDGDNSTGYDASGEPVTIFGYSLDDNENAIITSYVGNANALVIPDTIDGYTVVEIGHKAFAGRIELITVDIPDTVTFIDSGAFANCTSLRSVTLPSNLTGMGAHAFYNCDALASIEIPKSLESTTDAYIYEYAYGYVLGPFYDCDGLKTIVFENGTTVIANGLFANCPGIQSVVIPDTVTTIEGNAFYNCASLQTVSFPASLTVIEAKAFAECAALTGAVIPDTTTNIAAGAFANCASLQTVTLPKSLVTMGAHAFYNCDALTDIEIPKALEGTTDAYFNEYAYGYVLGPFYNCDGLKNVTFEVGTSVIANGLFANCPGIETITIPNTVTIVENKAFYRSSNLATVTFSSAMTEVDFMAFAECGALTAAEIPNATTVIDAGAFANCTSLETVTLSKNLATIGAHAFYNCDALASIEIPKSLKNTTDAYINEYAYGYVLGPFYNCDGLKNVTFEEGASVIPNGLFNCCPGIEQITLPETITTLGYQAFRNCTALREITIPEAVTSISTYTFAGCTSLEEMTWTRGTTTIPEATFDGCTSLNKVTLPDNLVTIGNLSFRNCDSLVSVTMPDSVKNLYDSAFIDCALLEEIHLSENLASIPNNAFKNCDALTAVTVPGKVTSIGSNAFYDCDALETVTMGDSVTSMGSAVFQHCDLLKNVTLSRNLTAIPASAFQQCGELAEIAVPYYVTTIGNNAFNASPKLAKVILPRGLTSIGTTAFSYADVTVIYGVPGTYAETWASENGFAFVANDIPATSVSLNKSELTLKNGTSETLELTIVPADSTDEIIWKSSNTAVATVTDKGVVKAVGVGNATIKVTAGEFSTSCKITVIQPVTSVSLNRTSVSLAALETFQLTATANPTNAYDRTVSWASSNEAVASVDENGLVTAHTKGTASITATANDGSGKSRSCTVTVTNSGYVMTGPEGFESSHPYANSCTDFWIYTAEDAAQLSVTFDAQTEMEDGFDYLYIYDANGNQVGKYTGLELSGQTITVSGNTVKIQIQSDASGNEWGFKVTDIQASGHAHNYTAVVTAPTCTDKGYTTYTCSCADSYTGDEVPALGHDMIRSGEASAPTCTAEGSDLYECSRCDESEHRSTPALGHSYQDGKCTVCAEADPNYTPEPVDAVTIKVTCYSVTGKPRVTWTASDNAAEYDVYRRVYGKGSYEKIGTTANTAYLDKSAVTGTKYTYYVIAVGTSGQKSDASNKVNCTCDVARPEIKLSNIASSGKIKISWTAIDGAVKYEIYRATSKTGTYKLIKTTTASSYSNTSVTAGKTYYYKVRAIAESSDANSVFSEIQSCTCDLARPSAKLSNVASSGKIKISWSKVTDAVKYRIYRSTSKDSGFKLLKTTTSTSYTDSSAKAGTTYYYRVRAVASKSSADSALSPVKGLTCDLARPDVSIKLKSGKPRLTWDKVTGAVEYEVYRATSKTGTYKLIKTTTSTAYTNTGAKSGKTYYYKVKAIAKRSAANSAYSSVDSIKSK